MAGVSAAYRRRWRCGAPVCGRQSTSASREVREVGAGLALWPNAMRVLTSLGMGGVVRGLGVSDENVAIRNWHGAQLASMWSAQMHHRYGAMMMVVHRADMQAALLDAVGRSSLRLSAECMGFRQDAEGVTAQFADGREGARRPAHRGRWAAFGSALRRCSARSRLSMRDIRLGVGSSPSTTRG